MNHEAIDTNVIVRFLVETPQTIQSPFRGVFRFFKKIEQGATMVFLPQIVLFQAYFVLTSHYEVPPSIAAEKLEQIIRFKGINCDEKLIAIECLKIIQRKNIDLVDAWIIAYSYAKGLTAAYSFDKDLTRFGLKLLKVE